MSPTDDQTEASWRSWVRGAVAGLLTMAIALGVAELVRSVNRQLSSPIIDVGARFIDATPRWLKDFAIDTFGTNDKTALIVGISVLLVAYAVTIGIVSLRRRWVGLAGVAAFTLVGVIASAGAGGPWWGGVPSLVGGIVGAGALWFLVEFAVPPSVNDDRFPDAPAGLARRSFLIASAAIGAAAVVAGTTGRWLSDRFDVAAERAKILLPKARKPLAPLAEGTSLDVEGLTPFVTDNANFYRIDTALVAPQVPVDTWSLKIRGMVERELELTYEELLDRDLIESDITLSCVSNEVGGTLAGNARWLGVPLAQLLDEVGVADGADQIVGRSVDGFTAGFPVAAGTDPDRGSLVAVGMNGEPLPVTHGFPARLVVPGLYGYVSATKWLTEIELTRFDAFDAYWAERGWSIDGPIKTFSRIDTPGPLERIPAGRRAIAGVAWAQTRGIDAVEVRVDGGRWRPATLSDPVNDVTWRQWVIEHDFTEPGRHSIECRATDGTGAIQTQDRSEPFPDGATGWHSVITLVD